MCMCMWKVYSVYSVYLDIFEYIEGIFWVIRGLIDIVQRSCIYVLHVQAGRIMLCGLIVPADGRCSLKPQH